MKKNIRMLLIEDDPGDALLVREILAGSRANISITVSDRLSSALELIRGGGIDVILTDLCLPDNQGLETFSRVYENAGAIPIVVLTGVADEETALQAVHCGAQDYIYKGEIKGGLLSRILNYAIERRCIQAELADKISQLEKALAKVRQLEGIIPICMHCKKIRDDRESWQNLEKYITEHSEAHFSHGLCPECMEKYYGDYLDAPRKK